MENKKMIQTAGGLDVLAGIVEKVLYAVAALLTIFGVVTAVSKDPFAVDVVMKVYLGDVALTLRETDGAILEMVRNCLVTEIITAIIFVLIVCIGTRMIRKLLKPMKEGRPFDTSVADGLKKLGWLVLIGGIVETASELATEAVTARTYDFTQLFNMNIISDITVNYSADVTFLIFAFVLFLLSYIFRYGEALQRESDETL